MKNPALRQQQPGSGENAMQNYFDNIAQQMQEDAENHHRTINIWGDDEAQDAYFMQELDRADEPTEPATGDEPRSSGIDPAHLAALREAWARSAAIKENEKRRAAERRASIAKEKATTNAERRRENNRLYKAAQRERERAKAVLKKTTSPAVAPAVATISASEALRRLVAWIKAAPTASAQRSVKGDGELLKRYARAAALLSSEPEMSLSALGKALGITRAAAQNVRNFVRRNAHIFAPKKAKTSLPETIKYDDITDIEAMLAMAEEGDAA